MMLQQSALNDLGAILQQTSLLAGTSGVQAETTALLAAMSVQPSAARKTVIDNLIVALKNAGVWTTLDMLYVCAAHDAQAGRINWINPASVATATSSPTFTTDRGYIGTASGYLATGVNWSALTKFTQNSAHLGAWIQNDATVGNTNTSVIGGATNANRYSVIPKIITTNVQSLRVNGTTVSSFAIATSRGHHLGNRANSANFDAYKDGVLLGNTVVAASVPQAEEVWICRNTITAQTVHTVCAAHIGSSLTGPQITALNSALTSYMTAVGA